MAESKFASYDDLLDHVFQLYLKDEYALALEVLTGEAAHYPDRMGNTRHWQGALAALAGDTERSLAFLRQMHETGYWISEASWADADFDAVRDLAAFQQLRVASLARWEQAQAAARPELRVIAPPDVTTQTALPLLIALHGNQSSIRWHVDHWRAAAGAGWLVGLPQSSQVNGLDSELNNAYVWNDVERASQEIMTHTRALAAGYAVDTARMVAGGFSRGAEMTLRLVLTGQLAAQGVLVVCPGGSLTREPERYAPLIAASNGRDLRARVIVGGQDQYAPGGQRLAAMLSEAGISCELELHPEMGHDYPADFRDRLPGLLAGLLAR